MLSKQTAVGFVTRMDGGDQQAFETLQENDTECNGTYYTQHEKDLVLLVMSSVGLVSIITCSLTISLALFLRLYRRRVFRLAMYHVASSMLLGVNVFSMITLTSYISKDNDTFHKAMCQLTGFLLSYFLWMNTLFTAVLISHFFLLFVCLKKLKLKYLEILCVLFSLLFPLLFVWVPFINNNYGSTGIWCWIKIRDKGCFRPSKEGIIEQFVLWYVPSLLCLGLSIIAAGTVLIGLIWRRCGYIQQSENKPLILNVRKTCNAKALVEAFFLLAYPAVFFVLISFGAIYKDAVSAMMIKPLIIYISIYCSLGLFSSGALLTHIITARCLHKKSHIPLAPATSMPCTRGNSTVNYTSQTTTVRTIFLIPRESDLDKDYEVMQQTLYN